MIKNQCLPSLSVSQINYPYAWVFQAEREIHIMKITKLVAAAAVSASMIAMPMTASAAFYPADRPTYTCITPTNCPGADKIVFNSFTNNPVVGDERPFFAGSINGANVQDRIKVKDGDIVTLRAYVHNNADATKMGSTAATVAKNVKIRVGFPTISQKDSNLVAFITASNAAPATINDTMSLYADSNFTLSYVAGSAKFQHAADGVNQKTDVLSDSIVTDAGAPLGDITGCFAYSGYVTLQVKVSMPKPPVTPPTPPTTTTKPTPKELPNTGAGEVLGLFAVVTLAGAVTHRYVLGRRS